MPTTQSDVDADGDADMVFADDALYLSERDVLALSDLHVGLEEAARDGGWAMPLGESDRLRDKLGRLLDRFEPSTVVFDGDVHHSFAKLGEAPDTIDDLRWDVEAADAEPIWIAGNHDTMLDAVVETHDWWECDGAVFTHGDDVPVDLPDAELYVVGHDHPTLEIEMEKQRCYLLGTYRGGDLVMLPAFNGLCRGTVVNGMHDRDFMSPFVEDFASFRVVIETDDGQVLDFPRVGEFREML